MRHAKAWVLGLAFLASVALIGAVLTSVSSNMANAAEGCAKCD
jgi:hypothetical protein